MKKINLFTTLICFGLFGIIMSQFINVDMVDAQITVIKKPSISSTSESFANRKVVSGESFIIKGTNLNGNPEVLFYQNNILVKNLAVGNGILITENDKSLHVFLTGNFGLLNPGMYDMSVKNTAGESNKLRIEVLDPSRVHPKSLSLTSPQGGEMYRAGDNIRLTWNVTNPSHYVLNAYLVPVDNDFRGTEYFQHTILTDGYCDSKQGVGGCINLSAKTANLKISENIPTGTYNVSIKCWNKNSEGSNCPLSDISKDTIEIVGKDTAVGSKLIRFPLQGQNIKHLEKAYISWNATPNKDTTFVVRIEPADKSNKFRARNIATSKSSSYTWTVPKSIPVGQYYIVVSRITRVTGRMLPSTQTDKVLVNITTENSEPQLGTVDISLSQTPSDNPNVITIVDVPVFGIEFKGKIAPVYVQTLDLGVSVVNTMASSSENPGVLINTIKIWDGSTLLTTVPVNSSTFTRDSSNKYYVRIPGINMVIPQDATKILTVSFSTNFIDSDRAVTVSGYNTQSVRVISGNQISSFHDISSLIRTHTFKKTDSSIFGFVVLSDTDYASTTYVTSLLDRFGSTQSMTAVFDLNIQVTGDELSLDKIGPFDVYFERAGDSLSNDSVRAHVGAHYLMPDRKFVKGETARLVITAMVPGNDPKLYNGIYNAHLTGIHSVDLSITTMITGVSATFIKNQTSSSSQNPSLGFAKSMTANVSQAIQSSVSLMFGWLWR
jgi:hypothetical protein